MLPLLCRRLPVITSLALGIVLALPLAGLAQDPSGTFKSVTTEHNVVRDGRKGLVITIDSEVNGLRDKQIRFAAFFYQGDQVVPAHMGPFRSADGGVTSQLVATPPFDSTKYTGTTLFLPYEVINLRNEGSYELRYFVEIQYERDGKNTGLVRSRDFTLTLNYGNPQPQGVLDGKWSGTEDLMGFGDLTFEFDPRGVCFMTDTSGRHQGTWKRVGNEATLTFFDGRVVYRGTVTDRTITGKATNDKGAWKWSVTRVGGGGAPPPPQPPDVAPGDPRILVSRWALSHGRHDSARSVGILTPDNPKGREIPTVGTLIDRIANQPNPALINLELDPTGTKPANPKQPSPLLLSAAAIPSGMTLLVMDGGEAGWLVKHWDRTGPRFGKGNFYATVSIPAEKIAAGMELVTDQHFAAYTVNSILWEAPDFGDIVVDANLDGGTANLGATAVRGKKTKQITRNVGWADPFELELRDIGQTVRKDKRIQVQVQATLPAGFDAVRSLRWAAETKKGTLFGQVPLPAQRESVFTIVLPEETEGMVKISAVASPGPFVRSLDSVIKDGNIGLTTFHSFGPTLGDTHTFSVKAKDDSLDKKIADELEKAKAKSGDVQISLYWTSKNDLDLHVICPSGETIYYNHAKSKCGGMLDVDQNANQGKATTSAVENIFWPAGKAPRGKYQVYVNFYGNHGQTGKAGYPDPAPFAVRIVAQGRTQTFNGSVNLTGSNKKVLVHEFVIP